MFNAHSSIISNFSIIYSIPEKKIYCDGKYIMNFYEKIFASLRNPGDPEDPDLPEDPEIDFDTLQQIAVIKCIDAIKDNVRRFDPQRCFFFRRCFYDGTSTKIFYMDDTATHIFPLKYDSLESAFLDVTKNAHFKDSAIDENIISMFENDDDPIIDRYMFISMRCGHVFLIITLILALILLLITILFCADVVEKKSIIIPGRRRLCL